jgi:hypothetical protein
MTWAAVAIGGAAVVGAGIGYLSASEGADATEEAANTAARSQAEATASAERSQRESLDYANKQYNEAIARDKPFYDAGVKQIPTFEEFIKGYVPKGLGDATTKYELQTGTKALNRALASRGLSGSGNAANRIAELEMGVAARGEGREYTRWQDQYSRILDALKLGTGASSSMGTASGSLTAAAQSGANNLSNIYTQGGQSLSNIAQQQGANRASLYSGMAGQTLNSAALGIKAYDVYGRYNTPSNSRVVDYGGGDQQVSDYGIDYVPGS